MEKKTEYLRNIIIVLIVANIISFSVIAHLKELIEIKDINNILEILITVNGVFSAILTTFLFGRLNISKEIKKDAEKNAIELSQKITDLRRIFHELIYYFGVWKNDKATKYLLDGNKYGKVDYYDYKLMSFSDYVPEDVELIKELKAHKDYSDVDSDIYLSMISIANNRKDPKAFDIVLYDDYFDGELIYETFFIEKLLDINHLSRLSESLKRYDVFNYNSFSRENQERLNKLILRINPDFDLKKHNYKNLLSKACCDIEADTLPKLLKSLYILEGNLSKMELKIISIIKISLLAGVFFPLINITVREYTLKDIISEILIIANFCVILYFIFSIKKFSSEQV